MSRGDIWRPAREVLREDLEDELDLVREEADLIRDALREFQTPGIDVASGLMMGILFGLAGLITIAVAGGRYPIGFAVAFAVLGYPFGYLLMHWLEHRATDVSQRLSQRQLEIRQEIAQLNDLPDDFS